MSIFDLFPDSIRRILAPQAALPAIPYGKCPLGLDISKWQGEVDAGKAVAAGARYIGIRCCIGLSVDTSFEANWRSFAGRAQRAAYFVVVAGYPVAQQVAKWTSMFPSGYDGELPPVLDWELEDTTGGMAEDAAARLTAWAGEPCTIYSRAEFVDRKAAGAAWLNKYWWWLAQYLSNGAEHPGPVALPKSVTPDRVIIHQTSSHGDGPTYGATSLNIDLNRWIWGSEHFTDFTGAEEEPPQEEPTVNIWTTYPVGREIAWDAEPTADELKGWKAAGVEFVVIRAGGIDPNDKRNWGWQNPHNDKQIQAASDAALPAFSRWNPAPAMADFTQEDTPLAQVPYALKGVENNKTYGLILNGLLYYDTDGNKATDSNITNCLTVMAGMLDDALPYPVMVRSNDQFCQDNAPAFLNHAHKWPCVLADPRYRNEDNSIAAIPGSSAVSSPADLRAHLSALPEGWNNPYVPGVGTELTFWDVGVYGGVRWYIFKGTREQMYTRFNITATNPPTPPNNGDEQPTPTTPDNARLWGRALRAAADVLDPPTEQNE